MATLTTTGINKQLLLMKNSLSHASYLLNNQPKIIDFFKIEIEGDTIKIYVYLDDTIVGTVKNISLVDKDGDVIAISLREFNKTNIEGLLTVFAYKFTEVEEV